MSCTRCVWQGIGIGERAGSRRQQGAAPLEVGVRAANLSDFISRGLPESTARQIAESTRGSTRLAAAATNRRWLLLSIALRGARSIFLAVSWCATSSSFLQVPLRQSASLRRKARSSTACRRRRPSFEHDGGVLEMARPIASQSRRLGVPPKVGRRCDIAAPGDAQAAVDDALAEGSLPTARTGLRLDHARFGGCVCRRAGERAVPSTNSDDERPRPS